MLLRDRGSTWRTSGSAEPGRQTSCPGDRARQARTVVAGCEASRPRSSPGNSRAGRSPARRLDASRRDGPTQCTLGSVREHRRAERARATGTAGRPGQGIPVLRVHRPRSSSSGRTLIQRSPCRPVRQCVPGGEWRSVPAGWVGFPARRCRVRVSCVRRAARAGAELVDFRGPGSRRSIVGTLSGWVVRRLSGVRSTGCTVAGSGLSARVVAVLPVGHAGQVLSELVPVVLSRLWSCCRTRRASVVRPCSRYSSSACRHASRAWSCCPRAMWGWPMASSVTASR